MEVNVTPVSQNKARKKGRDPKKWKRNIRKKERYSAKALPVAPNCNHNKKMQCKTLSMRDLQKFHSAFYKQNDKLVQDSLILKCCNGVPVKKRKTNNNTRNGREFTIKYHIFAQKKMVPVCQKTFLQCLNITKYRVKYVIANFYREGSGPVERRGGNRKAHIFDRKQKAIKDFLNKLKCSESHYCRGNSISRRYLPSELSINKLYVMFLQETGHASIKKSYFRSIFNTHYNLGFGSPRTDVCSTCLKFSEKFKIECDEATRNNLRVEQRVHRLRANAFYSLLNEKQVGLKTFSFDCQKNLPLPKVPDQSCYYSRQLYLYNSAVVEGSSKDPLKKENVHCYLWTEDVHAKGSNEIASIVYDRLNKADLTNITRIRLVADGCVGQNKNSTMLGMLSKWITSNLHVKLIEVVFPVTGHSFMPADRVFGFIEKELRKRDTIVAPDEYIKVIENYATVIKLDTVDVFDWKSAVQSIMKPPSSLPFKITSCKRIIIKRSKQGNALIRGELYYKTDLGNFQNICKKNKLTLNINPFKINPGLVTVKPAKLEDVNKLLQTHYGNDWRTIESLKYYINVISTETLSNEDEEEREAEPICEPNEESPLLTV